MGTGKSTLSPVLRRLLSGFLLTSPDTTQWGEEENLPVGQDGISGFPLGFVHGGGGPHFLAVVFDWKRRVSANRVLSC